MNVNNDKEFSVKKWIESGEYGDAKARINREINSFVENTNSKEYRERYKKSPEERALLFNLKQDYLKNKNY